MATLAFIWGNSMESIPDSQQKSLWVLKLLQPVLEAFAGKGNATDHLVRKLAHFVEFGALGCELAVLAALRGRVGWQAAVNCLSAGLAVAVTDEAIQIFFARGAQVQDILLDFAGAATGIALTLLLCAVILRRAGASAGRGRQKG